MPAPPQQPTDFLSILQQVWWRLDSALDLEMLRWSAMLGAVGKPSKRAPRQSSITTKDRT